MPTIRARGCTLVGLSLTNLEDIDAVQLALPVDRVRTLALDAAVDEVRDKFGSQAAHARGAARPRLRHRDAAAAERLRTDPGRNSSVACLP